MAIQFPSQQPGGPLIDVDQPARVVVVGANGSGKTRFGIWLEEHNQTRMPVHRIGAQKALAMPDFAQVKNLEQAEKELYFGRSDQHAHANRKIHDRWGGSPATHLLSDYDKLLALLFAKEAERDRQHTQQARALQTYVPVPDSAIDEIVKLWGYLMPHRTISFYDGKVVVGRGTGTEYHAKEMSDGERVTLYLIGQCLTAPPSSLIVIDEPELHLHRSLMDKLWNKVEELCPQKSIVYITHDLDFAASRSGARKFWINSYAPNAWTWSEIPEDASLPENLVLELIGNRKPVLFCEGDRGGLDHSIYQLCYPDYHVVPRGSAEKVVESVKAINSNAALHTLSAIGIIDRDVRTDEELAALRENRIYALPFAEIENLLCCQGLIEAVAAKLELVPAQTVDSVRDYIAQSLREELERQVVLRASRRVRYHLGCYSPTTGDRNGLNEGITQLVAALDVPGIVAAAEAEFAHALASGSLDHILRVYNRKSISDRISTRMGLRQGEYVALLQRLMKGEQSSTYLAMIRQHLPTV